MTLRTPLIDEMVRTGFHQLADGKRMRYAQVEPGKTARGTIVIAMGRREFIEKKFTEVGREFLDRDFRLIFFEWRGQGLSDRFIDGTDRQRDHISDFTTHMSDMTSLYENIIRPNQIGPLLLCGHSMGGHLLLRWLIENPSPKIHALLLTSPMMALAGHAAHSTAGLISWGALKLGHATDYAPLQHDYSAPDMAFLNNPLTHDSERFAVMEKYFRAYPDMTVGGVTWGWLHAAIKSMHSVQRRYNLEKLSLPILTITGTKDRVTPAAETMRYLRSAPHADIVSIEGALHDVMNESDQFRTEIWRHMDRFLEEVL